MATTSNFSAAPTPIRQSCDRCYSQKLRCTRTGSCEIEACIRCLRQGVQCVYSACLPKGRPSMYRLAELAGASSKSSATTSSAAAPPPKSSDGRKRRRRAGSLTALPAPLDTGTKATDSATTNVTTNADVNKDSSLTEMVSACGSSTWIWPEPINWASIPGAYEEEQEANPSASSLQQAFYHSQRDGTGPLSDCFLSLPMWPGGTGMVPSSPPNTQIGTNTNEDSSGRGRVGAVDDNAIDIPLQPSDEDAGPDASISQLSQLSTRLYLLHRSSSILAEAAKGSMQQQKEHGHGDGSGRRLIDETAGQALSAWMAPCSTICTTSGQQGVRLDIDGQGPSRADANITSGVLHEAYTVWGQFLGILRRLESQTISGTPQSSHSMREPMSMSKASSTYSTSGSSIGGSPSSSDQAILAGGYGLVLDRYSNTAIRHLVLLSHTLLLGAYVAVLMALQHDADLATAETDNGNGATGLAFIGGMDPAATAANMRLFLVAQLYTHLIKRHLKAVDSFLSLTSAPQESPPVLPNLSSSTKSSGGLMNDLEAEVQERLARLKSTLQGLFGGIFVTQSH